MGVPSLGVSTLSDRYICALVVRMICALSSAWVNCTILVRVYFCFIERSAKKTSSLQTCSLEIDTASSGILLLESSMLECLTMEVRLFSRI